jgi:hypothetical protein
MMAPGAVRPPRLAVRPELTEADVAWLNQQMALTDQPPVTYARAIPAPPPPSGGKPSEDLRLPTELIRY